MERADGSTPPEGEKKKKRFDFKKASNHAQLHVQVGTLLCVLLDDKVIDPLWLISRQGDLIPNRTGAQPLPRTTP